MKNLPLILLFSFILSQIHFTDIPNDTGIYHPIIIEECLGLDIGDEIGLFDNYGLLSSDCSDEYGGILVGAGIYNGEQITISGIGSYDYCDFYNGSQVPGWIDGNSIIIKVWDASENIEYIPEVNYTTGTGTWGEIFSVIDFLIVHELSADSIDDFSIYKVYPNPFNSSITFDISTLGYENINISIFDLLGNSIDHILFNPIHNTKIIWDASNYNSGIYIVKFHKTNFSLSKKIVLIK